MSGSETATQFMKAFGLYEPESWGWRLPADWAKFKIKEPAVDWSLAHQNMEMAARQQQRTQERTQQTMVAIGNQTRRYLRGTGDLEESQVDNRVLREIREFVNARYVGVALDLHNLGRPGAEIRSWVSQQVNIGSFPVDTPRRLQIVYREDRHALEARLTPRR